MSRLGHQHRLERPHRPEGHERDPVPVFAHHPLPRLQFPLGVVQEHGAPVLLEVFPEVFVLDGRLVR